MNRLWTLLSGLGLGVSVMYYLDPNRGRARRALVRDQVAHLSHSFPRTDAIWEDIRNRATGLAAETQSRFKSEEVPDDVLEERARARLGRIVSHPGSIDVMARDGAVTLQGPVLANEVDRLLASVATVPGVLDVVNRLEAHEKPGNVPGLQGAPRRAMEKREPFQEAWAPATRVFGALSGTVLALIGLSRKGVTGTAMTVGGATLATRGVTNMPLRRLFGIGAGRRAVMVEKTINVNAPVERVFQLWTDYQMFPSFMKNVLEVRKISDRVSHWTVAGPAGAPVQWDAEITKFVPNQEIAWKTLDASLVQHSGVVHFSINRRGGTQVDVRLSYNPIAGALGHAVASLFGSDPKSEMDEDLMRMKSFIETGRLPHDELRETKKTYAAAGKSS